MCEYVCEYVCISGEKGMEEMNSIVGYRGCIFYDCFYLRDGVL